MKGEEEEEERDSKKFWFLIYWSTRPAVGACKFFKTMRS